MRSVLIILFGIIIDSYSATSADNDAKVTDGKVTYKSAILETCGG